MVFFYLPVFSVDLTDWFTGNVSVMSEADFEGDFLLFAFHKNDLFREKYFCETNMNLDLALMEINKSFFWMFRSEIRAGMGNSPYGMLLHPYDVSFAIIPTFEYRFPRIHVSLGLDHRCFHVIDRSPPLPVIYWNKLILCLNSPHRREHPFTNRYIGDEYWKGMNRLVWGFCWGYYMKDFFGLIEPGKMMSPARPYYLHDFSFKAKYGLIRWKHGAFILTGESVLGFKYNGRGTYWGQRTGAEALFGLRPFDTSIFVNYILDGGRFDSKDRLFEYGIRVVK